ncbi:MAG: hypothetical protein ACYC3Q_02885 [Gemmatimonadaceae bacterium]
MKEALRRKRVREPRCRPLDEKQGTGAAMNIKSPRESILRGTRDAIGAEPVAHEAPRLLRTYRGSHEAKVGLDNSGYATATPAIYRESCPEKLEEAVWF